MAYYLRNNDHNGKNDNIHAEAKSDAGSWDFALYSGLSDLRVSIKLCRLSIGAVIQNWLSNLILHTIDPELHAGRSQNTMIMTDLKCFLLSRLWVSIREYISKWNLVK